MAKQHINTDNKIVNMSFQHIQKFGCIFALLYKKIN